MRLTGAAENTVTKLLRDVGSHCINHHDRFVQNVTAKRVQSDERWAFCGAKEKNASPEQKAEGWGDVWTWTALDEDSKMILAYDVGGLAGRLANRVQLTTDGLGLYLMAVQDSLGWAKVDFARLVKMYGPGGLGQEGVAARNGKAGAST